MQQENLLKGFTLIEIMVVIAIIGILATLTSLQLDRTRKLARDTVRVNNMDTIRAALHIYKNTNNFFPSGTNIVIGEGTDCSSSACLQLTSGSGFVATGTGIGDILAYKLPKNPIPNGSVYTYSQTNSGDTYEVSFTIEAKVGDLNGPDCIADQDTILCTGSF